MDEVSGFAGQKNACTSYNNAPKSFAVLFGFLPKKFQTFFNKPDFLEKISGDKALLTFTKAD